MKYESLWDSFAITDKEHPREARNMEYGGTLDEVLKETEKIIASRGSLDNSIIRSVPGVFQYLNNRQNKNNLSLAMYASRILRSSMEHKIANRGYGDSEEILKRSIGLGLHIYRDSKSSLEELDNFRSYINQSSNSEILQERLSQGIDWKSWRSYSPKLSSRSVENLCDIAGGNNILLLALGNGGIAAGMDVYLRYCDHLDNPNSAFYVARFSRTKKKDIIPQLTDSEKEYIKILGEGRQMVLFDEDVHSGETLTQAKMYFEKTFSRQVKALANFSYSGPYVIK